MAEGIEEILLQRILSTASNLTDHTDDGEHHSEFGVHIAYEQLYNAVVFLAAIYVAGAVFSKVLKMPSLVGEIFAGIVLGPPLLEFVPNPEGKNYVRAINEKNCVCSATTN